MNTHLQANKPKLKV